MKFICINIFCVLCVMWNYGDGRTVPRVLKYPIKMNDVTKRRTDSKHLEQCNDVSFWEEQLGYVNVLAFVDSSWDYSYIQASKLKVLKELLLGNGMSEVRFFLINAASQEENATDKETTDAQLEKKVWNCSLLDKNLEVEPINKSVQALIEATGSGVFLIQDTKDLQMWKRLHASRDQIMIIDRCGKLAYQVIIPWSILLFPYVKAAILSTYNEEPCGHCNILSRHDEEDLTSEYFIDEKEFWTTNKNDIQEEDNLTLKPESSILEDILFQNPMKKDKANDNFESKLDKIDQLGKSYSQTGLTNPNSFELGSDLDNDIETEKNESTSISILPLRIIMHASHWDDDAKSKKHEYLVLNSDTPDRHEHIEDSLDENYFYDNKIKIDEAGLLNNVIFENDRQDYSKNDEDTTEKAERSELGQDLTNQDINQNEIFDSTSEESAVEEEEDRSKLIAHYSKLLPWIYFEFKN